MKRILLILAILALPSLLYADGSCKVVGVSLYDDVKVINGESYPSTPCATVTVKNMSSGNRLSCKVTAIFMDGTEISKSYNLNRMTEAGERASVNVCWKRKSQLESMECEF